MKLKKWCSLFLAFCMLAASISFPSSAEGESGSAPVFSEDFEGRGEGTSIATGNGWTVNTQTHGSLTVSRNNNNQMLEFALSENDTANPEFYCSLPDTLNKAVFSYSIAPKTEGGTLYLPVIAENSTGVFLLLLEGGKLKYQVGNTRYEIKAVTPGVWNTIKMVYDKDAHQAELYVDGEKVDPAGDLIRNAVSVNRISAKIYKQGPGAFYLDNFMVTAEDHVPAVPAPITAEPDPNPEPEPDPQPADVVNENFESTDLGNLPSGWKLSNPAGSTAKVTVEQAGENRVLVYDQIQDNSAASGNTNLSFPLNQEMNHAVLSFSVASKTEGGVFYLPTVGGSGGARLVQIAFNQNSGGKIQYQAKGESAWTTIREFEPMKWYTFKLIYDNSGADSTYELYIDGEKVELEKPVPRGSGPVTQIISGLYRKVSSCFYVDNIRLTEQDHTPEVPAALPEEKPEPGPDAGISCTLDFEEETVGQAPKGWNISNQEQNTVVEIRNVDGNKALVIDQTFAQSKSLSMNYHLAGSAAKGVLKYRVRPTESSGALYLPSFYSDTKQLVKLALNGGVLQKDVAGKWVDIMTCEPGRWYEMELVLDTEKDVYDLYVNGGLAVAGEKPSYTGSINRIGMGVYYPTVNTFAIDDIAVTEYVEGTSASFAQTEYEVVKGQTLQLALTYTPSDTSSRTAVWRSSDPDTVSVDALGNVKGQKEGSAVITAAPVSGLPEASVTVTVTNIQPNRIEVTPASAEMPLGSHQYLTAKVLPENVGNTAVRFESMDESVAAVDEYGEITAAGAGETKILVISEENEAVRTEVPVKVTERPVQLRIYVSPSGNDANDGTAPANAVLTLARAQEIVRANNGNMTGDIEVLLAPGYYRQSGTLKFDQRDSGSNGYFVIYRQDGLGEAVIGGGIDVGGFTQYDAERNIYVADVPGLVTRQLYVNGVRAVRARSEGGLKSPAVWMDGAVNKGFISENTEFASYAHPEDLEFVFQEQWTNPRCGVESVAMQGGKVQITMKQPGWKYCSDKGGTSASVPVYYENALELLDEPGEWYLDTHDPDGNKLYYMPFAWEDMAHANVTAPTVEELLTVIGEDYDHMVTNLEFSGITFADTTWMRPSSNNGHADAQNNHIREQGSPDRLPDAAVTVKRANTVLFTGCTFTRMGITALKMVEGVQNSHIVGNRFFDISGSAVNIGDPYTNDANNYNPPDLRMMMKNDDILNNYIHDIAVEYQSAAAVSVGFAADMDMKYNEIFDIPYSGFHVGYGWAKRFENVQKNMHIENNFIHDLMGNGIYDGGAIYFNGNSGGSEGNYNVVSGNYIRNQMDLNAPLYADEGTTYWEFSHNVVDLSERSVWHNNAAPRWLLVYVPTIENLKVHHIYTTTDNKYVNPSAPGVTVSDVTVCPDAVWPAAAQAVIDGSGLQASYAGLRNNQAERVRISNVKEDDISIGIGKTFRLETEASDGKDRAVNMAANQVCYRVADESVAAVASDGTITGKKAGSTTVYAYVISGGIRKTLEKTLYVGDTFERIAFREIDGSEIVLGKTSKGKQLTPYGLTDMGREVELTNVTYSVKDSAVAAVTGDGFLTPAGAGQTMLTVTGTSEGVTVTRQITVVVEAEQKFVRHDMSEIYSEANNDSWAVEGGSFDLTPDAKMVTTLSKFATFTGRKYNNELLTFKLQIDANGKGSWPSIVLRAQESDLAVAGGGTGYIICFGSGGLEVHRFNGTKRTVIYGNMDGYESLGGDTIRPEPLTHGEEHLVEAGALTNGDAVRLLLKIDGKTVFDFTDDKPEAVLEAGYFGLVGRGETFTLTKAEVDPNEPVDPEDKPKPAPDHNTAQPDNKPEHNGGQPDNGQNAGQDAGSSVHGGSQTADSAGTGDHTPWNLYLLLAALAAGSMAAIGWKKYKNRYKKLL
ncbi:Ig-like domain-containing protein [Lachnotalea sp. AF33-28]|uniref:Ig-like domain-containing protein n=1 Tax=Lachnotalea sp. AF33-28 TaxID=2292046 RepID=UPI000E50DA3B|nr:Ig-like domain-containing protein [Lachnotalea sp. AF33-28]RHP33190.1 hypothetical protein DWZ56_11030 [Lachnotalea sp. AF33-28]